MSFVCCFFFLREYLKRIVDVFIRQNIVKIVPNSLDSQSRSEYGNLRTI